MLDRTSKIIKSNHQNFHYQSTGATSFIVNRHFFIFCFFFGHLLWDTHPKNFWCLSVWVFTTPFSLVGLCAPYGCLPSQGILWLGSSNIFFFSELENITCVCVSRLFSPLCHEFLFLIKEEAALWFMASMYLVPSSNSHLHSQGFSMPRLFWAIPDLQCSDLPLY